MDLTDIEREVLRRYVVGYVGALGSTDNAFIARQVGCTRDEARAACRSLDAKLKALADDAPTTISTTKVSSCSIR